MALIEKLRARKPLAAGPVSSYGRIRTISMGTDEFQYTFTITDVDGIGVRVILSKAERDTVIKEWMKSDG